VTRAWRDGTQGDGFELKEGRFRLAVRRKFFTVRVVRPWHRLPVAAAPSLAVLKAGLDGALSTLGWWKVSLPMAGGWIQMIFEVPSNPDWSVVLWTGLRAPWSGGRGPCPWQRGGSR